MKKAVYVLCCLAAALLLLPSDLPAPGYPCIEVTKQCADPLNSSQLIPFWGTVRNCGYLTLENVTVVDNRGTADTSDDFVVFGPASLAVGASASFDGTYLPSATPSTNTVTATGSYPTYGLTATDTASATCKWLGEGCSLTWGYWKTHSKYGPAPYDNAWALLLPAGEDSIFFLSGNTYFEILGIEPRGNPYYSLAHQFIAAQLNLLNGAAMPADVLDAWTTAKSLFETYSPGQVGQKGAGALRAQFTELATALDYYNMGATGPGHCNGIER